MAVPVTEDCIVLIALASNWGDWTNLPYRCELSRERAEEAIAVWRARGAVIRESHQQGCDEYKLVGWH